MSCHRPLQGMQFYDRDGAPQCEDCYVVSIDDTLILIVKTTKTTYYTDFFKLKYIRIFLLHEKSAQYFYSPLV